MSTTLRFVSRGCTGPPLVPVPRTGFGCVEAARSEAILYRGEWHEAVEPLMKDVETRSYADEAGECRTVKGGLVVTAFAVKRMEHPPVNAAPALRVRPPIE